MTIIFSTYPIKWFLNLDRVNSCIKYVLPVIFFCLGFMCGHFKMSDMLTVKY